MNRFIKIIHLFSFPYIYTNLLGIMILESYPIFPSMSIGFLFFLKKRRSFCHKECLHWHIGRRRAAGRTARRILGRNFGAG